MPTRNGSSSQNSLQSDIGGSPFARSVIGVDRQNDFVKQNAVGKFGNSDWYATVGNEITRGATRSAIRQVESAARRGGEYAQDVTNALKKGYNQFDTPSGVAQMRLLLKSAQDGLLGLKREVQAAAGWAGAGVAEVSKSHEQQQTYIQVTSTKDFGEYAGKLVSKMDDRRVVLEKGIEKLESQLKKAEKKLGL